MDLHGYRLGDDEAEEEVHGDQDIASRAARCQADHGGVLLSPLKQQNNDSIQKYKAHNLEFIDRDWLQFVLEYFMEFRAYGLGFSLPAYLLHFHSLVE